MSKKRNSKEYLQKLNELLDEIFFHAAELGMDIHALTNEAGISLATAYRIRNRETECPYLRTIWKLAKAVNMEVHLVAATQKVTKRKAG